MSSNRRKSFWDDDDEIVTERQIVVKSKLDRNKLVLAFDKAEMFLTSTGGEWFTRNTFLEAVNCRRQYSRQALKDLIKRGRLERQGSGRPRDPFLYRLNVTKTANLDHPSNSGTRKKVFFV